MDMKSLVSTKRRKLLLTSLAILAVICTATAVYAAFTVTSNVVHISMTYSVVLTAVRQPLPNDDQILLTATVTPPTPAVNVQFWVSINGAANVTIGPVIQTTSGVATYTYTVTSSTEYDFVATVHIGP